MMPHSPYSRGRLTQYDFDQRQLYSDNSDDADGFDMRTEVYVPPLLNSQNSDFGPAVFANMPGIAHSHMYMMHGRPQGMPMGCLPMLVPMSPVHARYSWPGVESSFGAPYQMPLGITYGYPLPASSGLGHPYPVHSAPYGYAAPNSNGWARGQPRIGRHAQRGDAAAAVGGENEARNNVPRRHEAAGAHGEGRGALQEGRQPLNGEDRRQSRGSSDPFSGEGSSEASTPKEGTEIGAPVTGSDTANVPAGARVRGRRGAETSRTWPPSQGDMKASIACTIYICDLHLQITEEMLANCFQSCGVVTDVRVCGDCNQDLRFAFLEFSSKESVEQALALNGQSVAGFPLRISRSKTAIMPVNSSFLPRSGEEREQCSRTIYVSNLDRQVDRRQLMAWFHKFAGPISAIRMKNDMHNNTRIAFIEFASAADAQRALRECSGALLGMLPVRISPSKTPVRADQRNRN